jgi:beta-lactamase superfamily II metal-dependent hydrolase
MRIRFLKASNGDCILMSFTDETNRQRNILIDSGVSSTYLFSKDSKGKPLDGPLKIVVQDLISIKQKIDLLILTHVDDDHIDGAISWFEKDPDAHKHIGEVWFNSGRLISDHFASSVNEELDIALSVLESKQTSIRQGVEFGQYIDNKGIWYKNVVKQGDVMDRWGMKFKILSPDNRSLERLLKLWKRKDFPLSTSSPANDYAISVSDHVRRDVYIEDDRVSNGSSIAFVACWQNHNFLLLGDAHPNVLINGLELFGFTLENPIVCDLTKLSHHGSARNTSYNLLKCINCDHYVVSTDGNIHGHPDKQMLSRLIAHNPKCTLWFNYAERINLIFSDSDKVEYSLFRTKEITNDFNF